MRRRLGRLHLIDTGVPPGVELRLAIRFVLPSTAPTRAGARVPPGRPRAQPPRRLIRPAPRPDGRERPRVEHVVQADTGGRAVRPRPAQQFPPDHLPGSSEAAAPLAFRCKIGRTQLPFACLAASRFAFLTHPRMASADGSCFRLSSSGDIPARARAPDHAGHAPRPAATPASPGAWRVRPRRARRRHAPSPRWPLKLRPFRIRRPRPFTPSPPAQVASMRPVILYAAWSPFGHRASVWLPDTTASTPGHLRFVHPRHNEGRASVR